MTYRAVNGDLRKPKDSSIVGEGVERLVRIGCASDVRATDAIILVSGPSGSGLLCRSHHATLKLGAARRR